MTMERLEALVTGVVRQPSANPQLTLAVVAIAVLAVAIVVVLALMVMPRRTRRVRKIVRRWVPDEVQAPAGEPGPDGGNERATNEPEPAPDTVRARSTGQAKRARARRRLPSAVSTVAIVVLIAAALASAYAITGTDEACLTCHAESPAVLAVHENDHAARAACTDCHERGGGADVVVATVARTEMLLMQSGLPTGTVEPRPVSSEACERCHDVTTATLESSRVNIRVSHAEPLAAGMNCVDCHGPVGHLGETGRVPVSMERCFGCHNGDAAPAECETCHMTDIATVGRDALVRDDLRVIGSGQYQYPTVVASDTDCSGCHQVETQCDPCHGLRLPHPDTFVQGYHAKAAAFEKKEACYRCHEKRDCQSCHAPFSAGHASNWKTDHARSPWDAGCGCHGRDENVDVPICVFCHDNAPAQTVGSPGD